MARPDSGMDVERYRRRLFGAAYRMLGRVQDAEDAVQEAFLRWHQEPRTEVREPEAWLVSVVTRIAIDRLRRRARERETYTGPWLPEPAASHRFELPPDSRAERAEDLSMAFMALMERLAPEERAAFLMREVFGSGYADIALAIQKSEAAARQLVHRARERVRSRRARFEVPGEAKEKMLSRFVSALQTDNETKLIALFTPDATFTSDGGGKVAAARHMLQSAERIAHLLHVVETKFGHPFTYVLGSLNGEPALIQYLDSRVFAASFIETDGERITAMYRVMNPDKLGDVR